MINSYTRSFVILLVILVMTGLTTGSAQTTQRFHLGYFEGGLYPGHSVLRNEFTRQLRLLMPTDQEVVFAPEGYRSAGWKRDSCRIMARQLAAVNSIDMVVAMGPWVVEDLLEAGFDRPILAMHQFDPVAQGLLDTTGRPIASNLTVQVKPGRLVDDLRVLTELVSIKKLGVLYFPSRDESARVLASIDSLGQAFGFELVTADGFDNFGTFAFFKAFNQLPEKPDALYLPPLWGMNEIKISEFLAMIARRGIPTFTSEGRYLVSQGALCSSSTYGVDSDARYNALKAVRILQGDLPANLATEFRGGSALGINEQTADQCGVTFPPEALHGAYLVPALAPETATYYSLPEAVERTLSSNPGHLAQQDALTAAIAAARQAYSSYLPQIEVIASAAHFDDRDVVNSRGELQNDRYRTTLRWQQTVFSADAIQSIRLKSKQRDRRQIKLQQTEIDLELAVAAAYLSYLQAREALQTVRRYQSLADRNLEIAGTRFLIEDGSEIDLLRLKDERQKAITRLLQADHDLKTAALTLNVLFNLPGDHAFATDTISFTEGRFFRDYDRLLRLVPDANAQARLRTGLVHQALQTCPVMQERRIEIAIGRNRLSKNSARFYPMIDFEAALNYADRLADKPPDFFEEQTTWSVWGGLTLPIFLGTDRTRERAVLRARLSQAEFEKDAASLEVMGRIHRRTYDLVNLAHSLPRVIRSAELAAQSMSLTLDEYDAGHLGLVDLLQACDNGREAELAAVKGRYNFYLSVAQLVHDVGWSVRGGNRTFLDEFFGHLKENTGR